ncbi:Uncharacterized protein dnm_010710 [Desulfonema magnum]|uniref:Uncharacterized protein n=1 Tax=Desulfonema magnum TaxID=45655 RepID=A0A975BGN3_9BACT|nr:Uncharacterized protein dnm_010710 [Desulfonema magnum]
MKNSADTAYLRHENILPPRPDMPFPRGSAINMSSLTRKHGTYLVVANMLRVLSLINGPVGIDNNLIQNKFILEQNSGTNLQFVQT